MIRTGTTKISQGKLMRTRTALPVLVAAAIALGGCAPTANDNIGNAADAGAASTSSSTKKAATKDDGTHTVVLAVAGSTKKASITYGTDGAGGQAQDTEAKVPWKKTLKLKGNFLLLSVLAQNQSSKGTVSCSISVDGKKVKANESNGGYSIATCNYTVSP